MQFYIRSHAFLHALYNGHFLSFSLYISSPSSTSPSLLTSHTLSQSHFSHLTLSLSLSLKGLAGFLINKGLAGCGGLQYGFLILLQLGFLCNMASSKRLLAGFVFVIYAEYFLSSSQAYNFIVGGKDGWVLNPSEDYNHWAGRNRFQVNDTLCKYNSLYTYTCICIGIGSYIYMFLSTVFKYNKGSDSVLVVTKDDYFSCNTKNPITSLTDGESVFKFDRSGPFFFVSGNVDNCRKGQKLVVVVLAVRDKPHRPPPAATPPASSSPPPPEAGGSTITPASPPLVQPPSGLSPGAGSPESWSPKASANPTRKSDAPAGFSISAWVVLSLSVGVSVVLGSFVGMFQFNFFFCCG